MLAEATDAAKRTRPARAWKSRNYEVANREIHSPGWEAS